jgi:hypothetical protein
MTIINHDDSTSNRTFEITQDALDNTQMKDNRRMHELANKTNYICYVRSSNNKINKLTHKTLVMI